MQAIVFKINKRFKSTARPALDTGVNIGDVYYKYDTSIINPTIEVYYNGKFDYNYVSIDNQYYWINNPTSIGNNRWRINCTLDVLATYVDNIKATNALVVYSSNNGSTRTPDTRNIPTSIVTNRISSTELTLINVVSGYYVLSVMDGGGSSQSSGFCTSYVMSWVQLNQLAQRLVEPTFWEGIKDYFANPYDSIISCAWLPLLDDVAVGRGRSIKLGDVDTGITGVIPNSWDYLSNYNVSIPWGSTSHTDYTYAEPYTRIYLTLPFVGIVSIAASEVINASELIIYLYIDVILGDIGYRVCIEQDGGIKMISEYTGCCASQMPIGKTSQNVGGLINGVMSIAGGAATAAIGGIGAGISTAAIGMTSGLMTGSTTQTQINGKLSSRLGALINSKIECRVVRYAPTYVPSSIANVLGLPCNKILQLSNCTGYVQCSNANVVGVVNSDIANTINDYLNGGMYIE